jgi:hypothetical protein
MKEPYFDFVLLNQDTNAPGSLVYHLEKLQEELSTPELMVVKKANDWLKQAQQRPIPSQLFSEFWFE